MAQIACMDMDSVLGVLTILTRSLSEAVRSEDGVRVRRLGAWAWGLLGRCREVGEMGSEAVGDIRELGKRAVRILSKIRENELRSNFQGYGTNGAGGIEDVPEASSGTEKNPENGESDVQNSHVGQDSAAATVGDYEGSDIDYGSSVEFAIDSQPAHQENIEQSSPDELEAAKARLQARLDGKVTDRNRSQDNEDEADESIGGEDRRETEGDYDVSSNSGLNNVKQDTRAMLDMIITIVGEFYGQRDLLEFRDMWEEE